MDSIKKNSNIKLEIESLAFGGKGIAKLDGFTVFVERSLPGQKVIARIVKKKKSYAEAVLVDVIEQSKYYTQPRCSYFGHCGGCLFQNLDYTEQLKQKQHQVQENLEHIGGFANINALPTLASPENYYYRNKMEYTFSNQRWLLPDEMEFADEKKDEFALGLHVPNFHSKILDIRECFLLSQTSNAIMESIRNYASNSKLKPYTTKDHSGFWRFLVIRESKKLNQTMINIVTADHPNGEKTIEEFGKLLIKQFPSIKTIVHNVNRKKAQIAFGDEEKVIYGPGYIEEQFNDIKYRISANSFFQTNSLQAEQMYQLILKFGNFQKNEIVYDMYSGTGSIAIFIANYVKKVIGFEIIKQAIQDAKINCQINNISNCEFMEGDLKNNMANPEDIIVQHGRPTTVIIDPPRSGLHPSLPENILNLRPEKIIYVSCNPATLARDLKVICEKSDFKIKCVQPIDMFPNTAHCETIVSLEKSTD